MYARFIVTSSGSVKDMLPPKPTPVQDTPQVKDFDKLFDRVFGTQAQNRKV